jgi:hypothetical protein
VTSHPLLHLLQDKFCICQPEQNQEAGDLNNNAGNTPPALADPKHCTHIDPPPEVVSQLMLYCLRAIDLQICSQAAGQLPLPTRSPSLRATAFRSTRRCEPLRYDNDRFLSGSADSLDRERPFFNIVSFRKNVAIRAPDLDTKDVQIQSERITKTSYAETSCSISRAAN